MPPRPAKKHSAKSRSEFAFIAQLRRKAFAAARSSGVVVGIGDDGAIVCPRTRARLIVAADMLIEEIDFRREWTNATQLGHKALAVSLSDIAAMGARARWALVALGVPHDVWQTDFLDRFYRGLLALARQSGVALIGGDLSRSPDRIVIDSIVLGEAQRPVLRSGARPGDLLFVTGALGGAAAGLRLLKAGATLPPRSAAARLIRRHFLPRPRLSWGRYLAEERLATAMIDISDGLSSDLAHLCRESGVGATIDAALIPVDPLIVRSSLHDVDPLRLALDGGEDFELLFTVRPRDVRRLPRELDGVRAVRIGEVTARRQLVLIRDGQKIPLRPGGFVHFNGR